MNTMTGAVGSTEKQLSQSLLAEAMELHAAGLSPFPCQPGEKRPFGEWKEFQSRRITADELRARWSGAVSAFGLICGKVDGGLVAIDEDEVGALAPWRVEVGEFGEGLCEGVTGSGCGHIYFRMPDPVGNVKLAHIPADNEEGRTCTIETRGEGGFIVVRGVHPETGEPYTVTKGDLKSIPTLTQTRAEFLLQAARKLDQCPKTKQEMEKEAEAAFAAAEAKSRNRKPTPESSVIEAFNSHISIRQALERCNYVRGPKGRYIRPTMPGETATESVVLFGERSFHHSTKDPMHDGHAHTPFDLVCFYEYGGKCGEAVKGLAREMNIPPLKGKSRGEFDGNWTFIAGRGLVEEKEERPVVQSLGAVAADGFKSQQQTDRETRRASAIPPFKPMPLDCFPEAVRDYIITASNAIGVDPAFVAVPLLAALASAIGDSRRIRLKHGWTEPPSIFAALIAPSGSMKTPALGAGTEPAKHKQDNAFRDHARAMSDYAEAKAAHDAEYKGKKNAPAPPLEPIPMRYLTSDPTVEALLNLLCENPRGLLVCKDELAGWIRSFNEYKGGKGGDLAHWLSIWSAASVIVDRKTTGKKTIYVPQPVVSVVGTIQPGTLAAMLTTELFETGGTARVLFTEPPVRIKQWTEFEIPFGEVSRLRAIFDELYRLQPHTDDAGARSAIELPLSADAKPLWVEWFNNHAERIAAADPHMGAALSKLEAYGARLSLIMQLARAATEGGSDTEVEAESIRCGTTLADWFLYETERVYRGLGEGEASRRVRKLEEYIQAKGGTVTVRNYRRWKNLGGPSGEDEAVAELQVLVGAGRAKWDVVKGEFGRTSKTLRLLGATDKTPDATEATPDNDSENGVPAVLSVVSKRDIGVGGGV